MDRDGLPDDWELSFGLDPAQPVGEQGASAIPITMASPTWTSCAPVRTRAASSTAPSPKARAAHFFDVRFALFNPDAARTSRVLVRYFTVGGHVVTRFMTLGPRVRLTVDPEQIPGLEDTAFSTEVAADSPWWPTGPMAWDKAHHGSHAETGVPGAATTWYFAEGATHSNFDLYYLVQNPANARRPASRPRICCRRGRPCKTYVVAPASRFNIWVNREDPRLARPTSPRSSSATVPSSSNARCT